MEDGGLYKVKRMGLLFSTWERQTSNNCLPSRSFRMKRIRIRVGNHCKTSWQILIINQHNRVLETNFNILTYIQEQEEV